MVLVMPSHQQRGIVLGFLVSLSLPLAVGRGCFVTAVVRVHGRRLLPLILSNAWFWLRGNEGHQA